jgi:phosphatidate phosphatase APP1
MARPHVAAVLHDAWNRRVGERLRERGWVTRVIPHVGYGSPMSVRVLGRVVHSRVGEHPSGEAEAAHPLRDPLSDARWWRDFVGAPAMDVPVRLEFGDRVVDSRTDSSGLIDVTIRGHGFPPGRHTVRLSTTDGVPVDADVLVIGATTRFGVVSDIDDTVISTSLPRPMIAAWNTFVREEGTRTAVPGMATLYREIAARHPGVPFIYLSTGSWNLAPNLQRFLRRQGFPAGPLLLTDWGPTNTGWFRSGAQHKRSSLRRLAREFPQIEWLLIGDDGQRDPKLYAEFAAARPKSVRAIAIRQLSVGEQVLSHGLPVATDELSPAPTEDLTVPVVRAPDGFALARQLRPIVLDVARGTAPMTQFMDEEEDDDA